MKKLVTIWLLLATAFTSKAQEKPITCDCPPPTAEQFSNVCVSIYQKSDAHHSDSGASFSYQEDIWKMSCVDSANDSKEVIIKKIQYMWNKYRESFRCYGYPTSIASDSNILKFSLDTGFTPFIYESVRKNKLDMNFIDPADRKTFLDFVQERITYIANLPPIDILKLEEYKRIYKLAQDGGAKHSKDL